MEGMILSDRGLSWAQQLNHPLPEAIPALVETRTLQYYCTVLLRLLLPTCPDPTTGIPVSHKHPSPPLHAPPPSVGVIPLSVWLIVVYWAAPQPEEPRPLGDRRPLPHAEVCSQQGVRAVHLARGTHKTECCTSVRYRITGFREIVNGLFPVCFASLIADISCATRNPRKQFDNQAQHSNYFTSFKLNISATVKCCTCKSYYLSSEVNPRILSLKKEQRLLDEVWLVFEISVTGFASSSHTILGNHYFFLRWPPLSMRSTPKRRQWISRDFTVLHRFQTPTAHQERQFCNQNTCYNGNY